MSSGLKCTPVKLFDRTYEVFGFPDEYWFNVLSQPEKYKVGDFNFDNLRLFIKPDSVCIDAGANMGLITLAMASLAPQGRVLAFEADPRTFEALRLTIRESGYTNVMCYPFALGIDGARGMFVEEPACRSSGRFIPGYGDDSMTGIDVMKLDRVDLMKIDVEGAELDVLEGAHDTLIRCKPTVIMEFNSFAFVHYRNIVPRHALKRIMETFPWVGYFEKRVGKVVKLRDTEELLRNNFLVNSFVDDLVCNFDV